MGITNRLRGALKELSIPVAFGVLSFVIIRLPYDAVVFLISILLFSLSYFLRLKKKPHVNIKDVAGAIFTGSFPTLSAIGVAILFIIYTSWLAEFLEPGSNSSIWDALTTLFLIFTLPSVFVLSLHEQPPAASSQRDKKKVFIGALSTPKSKKDIDKLKQILSDAPENLDEKLKNERTVNWAPIVRAIIYHTPVLEKVFLLVSEESNKHRNELEDILEIYKKVTGTDFVIDFIGPVSFNDYEDIHHELRKVIKKIKSYGYDDRDISVYISPGTAAVTLALTLLAVKEGRQVEYLEQGGDYRILGINVSIEDIFSLAPELRAKQVSDS